ncbi:MULTISPECIES: DUF4150 domain-containing protein [Neorhizobium]|uniref:DUF4150 domain-containing protein n=1 Tax=Neorhizobium TaxID=1525371 RepID=UPI00155F2E32|nr:MULTISPECIES: DUF4150 domain-containing protein [Neorhizobium]
MAENEPAVSDPEPMEYVRVDPVSGKLLPLEGQGGNKAPIQKPTAPDPPPPEIIPKESTALAIVTSPDVCRSPQTPIPYMTWGKGSDNLNYSPDVRANGQVIKLQSSKFWCCYGDEPGVGRGIKSNTVGDVVEPVTSSTIVRANGQWVQRHTDRCTLNRGNAPGEYIFVKSVQTDKAPDGNDKQDKTRDEQIAEYAASKGWTRAADGGWNTNPGGFGWASNDKVGEEMDYVNSGRGNVQPFSMGSGPSELKPYTPSWTENIEHSVQDRLMSWGMDKYEAGEYGRKVGGLAGFVPGLGNGLSANDASRSFGSGQYLLGGIQSIGAVIGIGPGRLLTKGLEKGAEKVVQNQVERAAVKALEEKAAKEAAEAAAKKKAEDEAAATAESGAKGGRVTRRLRTKEELLPNGSVPGNRNGAFARWFDDLSPDELDMLWKDGKIRDAIEDRIRSPGNLHEWFMVSRTPTFKRWGVPMSDIKDLRTLTSETGGINPDWVHGGVGSTTAHNELLNIIDNSLSREDFTRQLNNWANYRLTNGVNDLPPGLRLGN